MLKQGIKAVSVASLVVVGGLLAGGAPGDAAAPVGDNLSGETHHEGWGQSQEFQWSGTIEPGQILEIRGVNGGIRAEAGGSTALVTAEKRGDGDLDRVRIEVVEHDDGVTICAVYPTKGGSQQTCGPGRTGHGDYERTGVHKEITVEFEVSVPPGVHLVANTVNGSVAAEEIAGDVDASTVNGDVRISADGIVEGRTVNGSIRATMGRFDEPLDFHTVNGSITLRIPAGAGAELRASTVNGSITTDFPVTVQGRFGRKDLRGEIGGGGPRLSLGTVNGSIRLHGS